ncbi:MAG: hypothetical protein IIA33_07390 [Planctomycetes bacterium]|nr:hypothetical protein [Planctomycetota bacterium]
MRKISAMAVLALFGTAGVLLACDKHKAGKVVLASAKVAPCSKTTFDNAVAGVMKTMPSMAYRVGDTDTHCFKSATAKAGENGKVQFLVASKVYDTETEATIALAGLLEKEIENLKTVRLTVGGKGYGCSMSAKAALKDGEKMKYRLAGFDFATREEADKALLIVNCKLKGCDADCIKDCMKNFRGTAVTAGAKKAGCNKSKAAAATVAAKDGAPCPHATGTGAALAGAKKSGCNKGKATTVAAKSDKPCCDKGNKAKAAALAAAGSPCSKSKAAKAVTVASAASPCSKAAKTTTVAAESKGGCCKKAAKRLVTAQDQIKLIVETGATLALSS